LVEQLGVLPRPRDDLRAERGRRPRVHHVGVADEAARPVALLLAVAVGDIRRWVDRKLLLTRSERGVEAHAAVLVDRIPHGEGNAEEALAAYAPVAGKPVDPVLVAGAHVGGMPAEFAPARDQRVAVLDRADEPLERGDDLDRPLALLVELHRAADGLWLADQIAAVGEQFGDPPSRLVDRG